MLKNGYSLISIEKTVTFFLTKLFLKHTNQPIAQSTAQWSRTYQIILSYHRIFTSRAEKKIKRVLAEPLPDVKITFVYRATIRHWSFFSFKDKTQIYIRSCITQDQNLYPIVYYSHVPNNRGGCNSRGGVGWNNFFENSREGEKYSLYCPS